MPAQPAVLAWPAKLPPVLASSSVAPQVKAGRLRVLAVTGAQPSKFNPEWPTLQSQGVKEVDASNWTLLLAPKGTPKEIVDKLVEASIEAVNTPSVREKLVQSGIVPGGTTPAQVAERFKADKQLFADAVKLMGIKGE